MKYFYIKCAFALLIIALTFRLAMQLVYPDNSSTENIEAQNQLIRTLAKGNVFVSSELLDFEDMTVFDTTMENTMELSALARQYLGKYAMKYNDTTYRSSNASITLNNFHMSYTPYSPFFSSATSNIMLANAGKIALDICEEYGIDTSDSQIGVSGGKDKISVSVMYSLDSHPVFNNALVLELTKEGLQAISGTQYKASSVKKNVRYAKKMEDALLEFMQECTDKSRETVITDIRLGYMLDSTESKTSSVSPVWRIIVDDTAIYYVSA